MRGWPASNTRPLPTGPRRAGRRDAPERYSPLGSYLNVQQCSFQHLRFSPYRRVFLHFQLIAFQCHPHRGVIRPARFLSQFPQSHPRVSPRQPPDHFPARVSAPIPELAPRLPPVPFDNCHHFLECATPLPRALSGDLPVALFDLRADFLDHGDATKDRLGFDLQMGRGREGPRQFLGNFGGHLQSDGYSSYDKIGGEGIVFMGCMTHARRGFVDALKINPKESHATGIVEVIGALYAVEADAREKGMSAAERLAARQQKSVPLLDELKKKIIAARQQALPQSALGKACDCALGRWERLIV